MSDPSTPEIPTPQSPANPLLNIEAFTPQCIRRCTVRSVAYHVPVTNEAFHFSPRYGSLRRTQLRQPTIITRLGEFGSFGRERATDAADIISTQELVPVVHKPPRLRLGKYTYQPIATFCNAPKAYPAKPHVEGFSPSPEKAIGAAAVVRNIRRNAVSLGDATLGRDVFTHFWAETSVTDSDPLRMRSSSRRSSPTYVDDLIYFDNSALESHRSLRGLFSSRTNEESDFGFGLESSRTAYESDVDTGRDFSDNELPDPESFEDFSSLLRNSASRVSSDLAISARRLRITQAEAQQAEFDAEYAAWDRETSGRSGSGFIDLFSDFWGNDMDSGRAEGLTNSIGTDTANLDDEDEPEHQRPAGRVIFPRNSPWSSTRRPAEVSTTSQGSSGTLLRTEMSSHARTRAEIVDRLLERQLEISRMFADIMDNNAAIPPEFANYPRRPGDPRSFLDQMSSDPPAVVVEDSEDECNTSVFSHRPPTPDLTPNALFETFSEGLKSLAEEMAAQSNRGETVPDNYFFEDDENYNDFCRGRSSGGAN